MFANPWALCWLVLAAPIVWLYRQRTATAETPVGTGAIWQQVFAEQRVRSWWLPRRHGVSLAVQLLVLVLAVLALAQPRLSPPRTTILILDNSGTMNAADTEPSRLEAARRHARRFIDSMPAADTLGILTAGTPVRVICTPTDDQPQLHEALATVAAGSGSSRMVEAVAVARRMLARRPAGRIVVLTDACFAEASTVANADSLDLYTLGGRAANVAVRRVAARREPSQPETAQVLVDVASFPASPLDDIPMEMRLNGDIMEREPVERSTGVHPTKVYELTTAEPGVLAVLAIGDDVLPADNRGSATIPPAEFFHVSLIGETSRPLEAALAAVPRVRMSRENTLPAAPSPDGTLVLQGELPPRLPAGPLLVVGPRNACDLWEIDGVLKHATIARQRLDSSILAGLDLTGLVLSEVARLKLRAVDPAGAGVLAATEEGVPLLLALNRPAGRIVVIGGNPDISELYQQPEFPRIIAQSLRWLHQRPGADVPGHLVEAAMAFPANESDLRVPLNVGTPAESWEPAAPWPAPWLYFGTLALALLIAEWCLYQRRWIS